MCIRDSSRALRPDEHGHGRCYVQMHTNTDALTHRCTGARMHRGQDVQAHGHIDTNMWTH
eukprot:13803237-Alexandrium_andersonii.AAC.1